MIRSAYSKRSNCPGCNSTFFSHATFFFLWSEILRDDLQDKCLQNSVWNFLMFFRSRLINNFIVRNNFRNCKITKNLKYLEIYLFLKSFHKPFWKFYLHKQAERFFFKKSFLSSSVFPECKTTNLGVIFCTKNTFFRQDYIN